jgi:CRP-like cAMP-binding protein/Fe-S-cluster-containing dehydrogenase component
MTDYLDHLKAEAEREVMACIGCNDCLLTCPLPEGQFTTIAQLNAGVLADRITDPETIAFVTACTQCGQCVPVCPADLHRADMVLWNKMKVEDVTPDRPVPLMVGPRLESSAWTVDSLARHMTELLLFEGVEVPHLRRIMLSVTLRRLEQGDILCHEHEFYERLYVVLEGALEQSTPTDVGHARILVLGPGGFHGELGVLGNHRDPYRLTAEVATTVVEFPKATIHRLMQESERFAATMNELYGRRALDTVAAMSPLLGAIPPEAMRGLLEQASFRVLTPGELLYREGDGPEDLYIVRSGYLRVARWFGQEERVLQYYREGDVCGATALLFGRPQSATVTANTRTELAVVPGHAVNAVLDRDPALRASLVGSAVDVEDLPGLHERPAPDGQATNQLLPLEGLLDKGIMQGHEVLMIDTSICTNCNACVDACERRHGYARLERNGLQLGSMLFPTACRHCEDPVCLLCSVNGIVREPDGEIRIVPDSCIGCGACAERCPYDNIQMHHRDEAKPNVLLDMLRVVPREKFEEREQDPFHHETKDRLAVKCDLCAGYDYFACVHACPVGAAMRVDPVALFERNDVLIGLEMKRNR